MNLARRVQRPIQQVNLLELMMIKLRNLFIAVLALAATPAMAVTINWGSINGSTTKEYTQSFGGNTAPGTYRDDFLFSLVGGYQTSGEVDEFDFFLNKLDIDTYVELYSGSSLVNSEFDDDFNFGSLSSGNYTLSVFSTITRSRFGTDKPVGYELEVDFKRSRTTNVPEPGSLALLGLGLAGLGAAARRRKLS